MTALRMASPEAWRQRHHAGYRITEQDLVDRSICPCCGRLLSRQWMRDIWGTDPEDFRQRVEAPRPVLDAVPTGFVDSTDERWFWKDERTAR